MIYTVTLNPALDRTIWIEDFKFDDTQRILREERFPGGKGIDVSRMIRTLGGDSVALGFIGGYTGMEIEGRLLNEGISHDFIRVGGETRTNIIVHSESDDRELKINAPGAEISPVELGRLVDKVRSLKPAPTTAVISGSIPPGLSPGIYAQLTMTFENLGANVILDADGDALAKGLSATPFMIKPNRHELSRLLGSDFGDVRDMFAPARALLGGEFKVIVLSAGEDGAFVITEDGGFHCRPPKIEIVNTVGSGDSMVAGIAFALERGDSLEDAVRLGVACGTATAMSEGTAQGTKDDIEQLIPHVKIQELP
ncbi:MAG TPA: 1-phosphofructokinase [candidate division Zixibacteria bacterium]|nr:1-phosphofructokinase [candidate division Zixibacteria bacterium]